MHKTPRLGLHITAEEIVCVNGKMVYSGSVRDGESDPQSSNAALIQGSWDRLRGDLSCMADALQGAFVVVHKSVVC